jgi:hypothetical protein
MESQTHLVSKRSGSCEIGPWKINNLDSSAGIHRVDLLERAEPRARSARHQRFFCTAAEVMEVGNATKAGQGRACFAASLPLCLDFRDLGKLFLESAARSRQRSLAARVRRGFAYYFTYITATAIQVVLHYPTTTTVLLHLSCRHSFALLPVTLRGAMGLS